MYKIYALLTNYGSLKFVLNCWKLQNGYLEEILELFQILRLLNSAGQRVANPLQILVLSQLILWPPLYNINKYFNNILLVLSSATYSLLWEGSPTMGSSASRFSRGWRIAEGIHPCFCSPPPIRTSHLRQRKEYIHFLIDIDVIW